MKHLIVLACASLALTVGCPSDDEAPMCTPGESVACTGPGGCAGGQVCREDGTGYQACVCDTMTDLGPPCPDEDGDGFTDGSCGGDDCDDSNADVNPGALEDGCNGLDDDCDGLLAASEDEDRDGFASMACGGDDCDDGDPRTYPTAVELCDRLDNDCDGSMAGEDLDDDGHLSTDATCEGGSLGDLPRDDCDDDDPWTNPSEVEVCDGADRDCSEVVDDDCVAAGCSARLSSSSFGGQVGDLLPGFAVPRCDGSTFSLHHDSFCASSATVVVFCTGWAPPCVAQSESLEAELHDRYDGTGLRVALVLTETADFEPPDLTYCTAWQDRFGLSDEVLIDPQGRTADLVGAGLPTSVLIDSTGEVVFREEGWTDGFVPLQAAIDALLGL